MSKTKSVVMTTLLTIVIAVLCFVCVAPEFGIPFRVNGIWQKYNSVVSVINYGSDLGGGYSAVYYPEGVIAAETYNTQVENYEGTLDAAIREHLGIGADEAHTLDELKSLYEQSGKGNKAVDVAAYDLNEYVKNYVAYTSENFSEAEGVTKAALYLEIDEVCSANGQGKYEIESEFKTNFENAVKIMAKRFDKKNFSSLSVSVKDGCTIQVSVPSSVEESAVDKLFEQMGYSGEFMLRASDEVSKTPLLRAFGDHTLSDYFKGASSLASGETGVVQINLTTLGKDKVYDITNTLRTNETDASLYFYVGENQIIGLGLSEEKDGIDRRTLYISGSFTPDEAENVAIVLDSCINEGTIEMGFSVGETMDYTVVAGEGMMTAVYVVFLAVMVAMFIFSIVRYKGLGVAHAYAYLSYLICMLMFVAFLPGMLMNASSVIAIALTGVTLVLGNYYIFENVRKEFNTGKTLSSAIKSGYKRSLAPVLDTHLVLFIIALVLFFISVGEAAVFAYVFLLGVLMSGVSTLLLTRYYWYIMRGLVARPKQHGFCGFKREVVEDDEE